MTLDIAILFTLLATMAYFFFTEKLPVELTAFAGLVVLIFLRFVQPDEAFTGFASPAVITMLSIFFLSAAILHSGVADVVGVRVSRVVGGSEPLLVATIMAAAGILSAFMNNIAATAVLLPAVAGIAQRSGCPPSRLFMPLSFGAILGGTTTLVGTPPNILAGEMLRERGLEPFALFDFTPIGVMLLLAGMAYLLVVGPRLLAERGGAGAVSGESDLARVYQLHESLFSIRVPPGSPLDGRSLREADLARALGVQIVGIVRGGTKQLAPDPDYVLLAGDLLLAKGSIDDIRDLFRVRDAELVESPEQLVEIDGPVAGIVAIVRTDSSLVGRTLREIQFRQRFGAIVVTILRDDHPIEHAVGTVALEPGDRIVAFGIRARVEEADLSAYFDLAPVGARVLHTLRGRLYVLRVPETSDLVGSSIGESRLGELAGLTVFGILRDGKTLLGLEPSEKICAGDRLLASGDRARIRSIQALGSVEIAQDVGKDAIESDDVGVVEVTIAPRSRCAGATLRDLLFREKHGLQVLAIWREGDFVQTGLAKLPLRFGDALLVYGPWDRIRVLAADPDFLVLSSAVQEPKRTQKAPVAIGGLLLMIAAVVTGWQPIHVAAFAAATFVVLGRVITMEEAYRAVEWRAVFLVAAILPVGVAMERTGAAALLSETVLGIAGPHGPYAVLAALVLLSSALSQALDGAPAVVLLTPVALSTATELGMDPRPIMMGISFAASAAFMTPFSHKANLIVMGAGGYRVVDYLKVGTPLTLVILAIIVFGVPAIFPL
jgi:di/tricarboxylate transporter